MRRRSPAARAVARPGLATWIGLLVATVACAPPGAATAAAHDPGAAATAANPLTGFRLRLDNDHFNFWEPPEQRPDFGYTHGTEFALRWRRAPRALTRALPGALLGPVEPGGETALELRLRQDIYSPWNIYNPERTGPDRGYAGWLEVAAGVSRISGAARHELLAHVGVTGPPSLAGAIQRRLHEAFRQSAPPDWSKQLPAEPGFGLEFSGTRRLARTGIPERWSAAVGEHLRARLSTWAVDLRLGVPVVAGWSAPELWPGSPGRPGFKCYVRANPHLDLIARDEFLDGPLFRDDPGPSPGARWLVAESEVAVGAGVGPVRLEWSVQRRTPEFDGQPTPHTYGSIVLSWDR